MENNNKEQISNNKEQIFANLEKKTWAIPELIVIDKKVIEGGPPLPVPESSFTGNIS